MLEGLGWLGVLAALLAAVGVVEYIAVLAGWRAEDERRARDAEFDSVREVREWPKGRAA